MQVSRTAKTAGAAISGSLAFLIQLFIRIPYPVLPWLVFDLAEIPIVVAFLVFGPATGFASGVILFLILLARGSAFPPGPFMKLAAVSAMLLGLWIGVRFFRRSPVAKGLGKPLTLGLLLGTAMRVLVMTPINYLIVGILFAGPFYFNSASKSLQAIFGWELASQADFLFIMLVFTGIYNVIHALISILPTYSLTKMPPVSTSSWIASMSARFSSPHDPGHFFKD